MSRLLNSSPSNQNCRYCNRQMLRVATRHAFAKDPVWEHPTPALVCAYCDQAETMSRRP